MAKTKNEQSTRRSIVLCIIALIFCLVALMYLRLHDAVLLGSDVTLQRMIMISLLLSVVLSLFYAQVRKVHGKLISSNIFNYPVGLLGVMCSLAYVFQFALHTQGSKTQSLFDARHNLSNFAQTTVVENWEQDAMDHPELNALYENIFGMGSGNDGYFLTREQWEKKGLNVPYIPFTGNELEWHFAAQFCQEMVNIVRSFLIDTDTAGKLSSIEDAMHSWVIKFRLFMKDPVVRNVWEQYRYHLANVHVDAWITQHVTNFVDTEPNSEQQQRNQWQKKQ